MHPELQCFDETQHALTQALAARDWDAIGYLDRVCREHIDAMLAVPGLDQETIRGRLEGLMDVYRDLLDATVGERQALGQELIQVKQSQNASKVYQLFS